MEGVDFDKKIIYTLFKLRKIFAYLTDTVGHTLSASPKTGDRNFLHNDVFGRMLIEIRQVFLGIILVLSILSCDCYVSVKGKVFTQKNKSPIPGAVVELIGRNIKVTTGKDGSFEINEMTGFCYDPHIKIVSRGYKPFEITFEHSAEKRSFELNAESEFVKYAKPFYPDSNNKTTFTIGEWENKFSDSFAVTGDSVFIYLDPFSL